MLHGPVNQKWSARYKEAVHFLSREGPSSFPARLFILKSHSLSPTLRCTLLRCQMMQLGMQLRGGLQAECSTRPAAVQPQCRLLLPVRRRCGVAARLAPSSSGLLQQRGRGRSQVRTIARAQAERSKWTAKERGSFQETEQGRSLLPAAAGRRPAAVVLALAARRQLVIVRPAHFSCPPPHHPAAAGGGDISGTRDREGAARTPAAAGVPVLLPVLSCWGVCCPCSSAQLLISALHVHCVPLQERSPIDIPQAGSGT